MDQSEQNLADEIAALRTANELRDSRAASRRKKLVLAALVAVLALGLLWSTGRMDTFLVQFGLNKNDCVKNGFGATFCGTDATNYQQNVASALGTSGASDPGTLATDVRAAVPSAEAYYSDKGSYIGMTIDKLRQIDSGITGDVSVGSVSAESYCLQAGSGVDAYSVTRPGEDSVHAGPC
jgi:hypothetical protein